MNIGVSAIRNHLETLEQKEYVKHSFKRVSKGRPKKMYKLTKKGSQLFPRMNKEILQKTIKFIDENLGRETLQNMLSEIATELGLDLEKKINTKESEEILQIKEALDDWGFYPKLSEEEAAYFIEYNNCLFPKIGKEFSGCFCGQIVSTATTDKTKVKEIKCRGNGKDKCLHKLIPQESEEKKK